MKEIRLIYNEAERYIKEAIVDQVNAQGHHMTGALEDSISGKTVGRGNVDTLQGFAAYYTEFVNEGLPASSASWKQLPFVIKYFLAKGLDEAEAKAAAAATIVTWMRDGMPTGASHRFSSTGSRTKMIEAAFAEVGPKVDSYLSKQFDMEHEKEFKKEKSETI